MGSSCPGSSILIALLGSTWRHTSKSLVTIPKELRQQLGIRQVSRIEFSLVGDHVEMKVRSSPAVGLRSGFGMLKSRRASVPSDFDPATLLNPARRVPGGPRKASSA